MLSFNIVSLSVCESMPDKACAQWSMVGYICAGSGGRLALSSSSGSRHRSTPMRPSGALAAYVQQLRSPTSRNYSCGGSSQALSSVLSS